MAKLVKPLIHVMDSNGLNNFFLLNLFRLIFPESNYCVGRKIWPDGSLTQKPIFQPLLYPKPTENILGAVTNQFMTSKNPKSI